MFVEVHLRWDTCRDLCLGILFCLALLVPVTEGKYDFIALLCGAYCYVTAVTLWLGV